MDGLLALDFWDMLIEGYVQPTTLSNQTMIASGKPVQDRTQKTKTPTERRKQKVDQFSVVDF